jgi:hypothetical protein
MAAGTPLTRLTLGAASVADDVGFVALNDLARALKDRTADYRVIGGHMVTMLAARWQLGHELYRETGDVDLGIPPIVATNHHVVDRLKALDYTQVAGNRFARGLSDIPVTTKGKNEPRPPEAFIDVLVPAYTSHARENVRVGEGLYTTEVPGLQLAIARPPVSITLDLRRLNAAVLQCELPFADETSALVLKSLATTVRSSGRSSAPAPPKRPPPCPARDDTRTSHRTSRVKEVKIAEDERFVICFNPEAAERDAAVRARMITQLEDAIRDSDQLSRDKRAELRGVISTRPGLNRYLRVTPGGLLRTDAARAKTEENLDGKYQLRTPDQELSAEDIALGYKQLLEVERGWRDMKQVIDLRPVCHLREDRIRAHVILCRLALLLARIAENATGQTWPGLRRELSRIHIGTFAGPAGTFQQRTELTKPQRDILKTLQTDAPPRIYQLKLPVEA